MKYCWATSAGSFALWFFDVGSFGLSYGYNLSGELTSITDFRGVQVGYDYDKMGRPLSVTGSGYGGVSSYVTSMAYRAFGAKQVSYNNGNRLRVEKFERRANKTQ
jgi:YD repeat-containing protein